MWLGEYNGRPLWPVVVTMMFTSFMCALDAVMVSVSMPEIARQFSSDIGTASWVQTGYLLGCVGFLLYFAKLAGSGKLKTVLFGGVSLFIVTSVACAMSPSIEALCVLRFIQGISGAMIGAVGPVMVVRLMPEDMKGRGMAYVTISSGIATIAGAPLGGAVSSTLGWHWLFIINVPLGIVMLILSHYSTFNMSAFEGSEPPRFRTAIVFSIMVSSALLLIQCATRDVEPYVMVIIAIILLISIALMYYIYKKGDLHQIVNPKVLYNRDFKLLLAALIVTVMAVGATNYLINFYIQIAWGYDNVMASLIITGISIIAIPCSMLSGKWCDKKGGRTPTIVSLLIRILFMAMLIAISPSLGLPVLLLVIALMGCSYGLSGTAQNTRIIYHSSDDTKVDATSLASIANYISVAAGLVLYVTIIDLTGLNIMDITVGEMLPTDMESIMRYASIISIVLTTIGLILSMIVKDRKAE